MPPVRRRALERLEQMRAGLSRHARAGVGDLDDRDRALAAAGDADLQSRRDRPAARLSSACSGVAHEIEQHPEQLVGIGVDRSPRSIALIQATEASVASPAVSRTSLTTGSTSIMRRSGGGLLGAAIGQRRLAERDGALQRAHQFWRKALHPRIGHAGELVRQQLRGGQQVAQIVVDLRHREARARRAGSSDAA